GLPQRFDAGDLRLCPIELHLEDERVPPPVAPEVVDDLDLVLLWPVDGGEVHQAVEGQGLVLLRVPADLHDVRRRDDQEWILVRGRKCANALTELSGET